MMSEHHEIAQAFRLAEISQQYTRTGSCPSQAFLGLGKEPSGPCAGENAAVGDAQSLRDTFWVAVVIIPCRVNCGRKLGRMRAGRGARPRWTCG